MLKVSTETHHPISNTLYSYATDRGLPKVLIVANKEKTMRNINFRKIKCSAHCTEHNRLTINVYLKCLLAVYGYGTLAVLSESLCALIGLVIVKWQNTPAYKYILVVMLGLSVGTMCADAILHLVPIVRKKKLPIFKEIIF